MGDHEMLKSGVSHKCFDDSSRLIERFFSWVWSVCPSSLKWQIANISGNDWDEVWEGVASC